MSVADVPARSVRPDDLVRQIDGPARTWRVDARPGDTDEAALVAASREGTMLAGERVADRLGGYRFGDLFGETDTNRMAVVRVDAAFLASLDARGVIDRGLVHDDLPSPRFRLADGSGSDLDAVALGAQRAPLAGTDIQQGRPFGMVENMQAGRTLVLNHLVPRVEGPLVEFANDASRASATAAQVNVYVSERDAPGFGRHWDDHDVLIVQCSGRKFWEVFAPAQLSALVGYVDKQQFGASVWSGMLEPGMGLYIPRGWGHEVRGLVGEFSLHYTIGFRRMNGVDLLGWAAGGAAPAGGDRWVSSADVDAATLTTDVISDEAIDASAAKWRARMAAHVTHGPFPVAEAVAAGFEGSTFRAPFVGGVVFTDLDDEGVVGMVVADEVFAVDRSMVPFLARLVLGTPVPFGELVALAGGAPAAAVAALTTLGRRDVVQLCET